MLSSVQFSYFERILGFVKLDFGSNYFKMIIMQHIFNTEKKLLIIFIFIGLIWGVLNFDILLNQGGDNGRYIMLGRSILEGKFMREVNTPAEELHKQYPPLFPLVLSFIMFIFGRENIFMMKVFSLIFYLLSILLFYLNLNFYFKKEKILKIFLVLIFIFAKNIVGWSSLVLSESLFIFLILSTLFFFNRFQQTNKILDYIIFLIFCTLSVFTRGNGVIVFLSTLIFLFLTKRNKLIPITFIFLILSQIWGFYLFLKTGHTSTYFQQVFYKNIYFPDAGKISFYNLIERIYFNTIIYFTKIIPGTFLGNVNSQLYYLPLKIIPIITFLGGLILCIRKKIYFETSLIIINLIVLILWPVYFSTERFFAPLFSLYLIISSFSIVWLTERKKSFLLLLYYIFLTYSILINFTINFVDVPKKVYALKNTDFNFRNDNKFRSELGVKLLFQTAIWAKDNTPKNCVIMSMKPELIYLYSDRKTVIFPYTDNDFVVINYMKNNRVDYIIFEDNPDQKRLTNLTINRFILKHKNAFSMVYTDLEVPLYSLLKVNKEVLIK
ncbi:MAG: glycosyltransferase family 39 protein [bacterium]|nr:glycosyltransferase family 39 protein [bacterium]